MEFSKTDGKKHDMLNVAAPARPMLFAGVPPARCWPSRASVPNSLDRRAFSVAGPTVYSLHANIRLCHSV